VPGIGRKTAERLLLELRDTLHTEAGVTLSGAAQSPRGDSLNALISLGYAEKEAHAALARLPADLNTSESIRQALRLLSKVL
jgi:Holliday junction DNA helicase RuvA